jgi:nitrite reductase/ring-hydroxylating ferredoxin subunit/uncharacterized membrane protein
MRSRAHFKAHPIHPALIPFPFAFLWGAAIFDLLHVVSGRDAFTITASHLTVAGLISGVLAAVPGAIDYLYAVPPQSSAKQRATKHALGNITALALFLFSWIARSPDGSMGTVTLVLEVLGGAIMGWSGLLGGELVVRNMISVDHRYADAGKWKEGTVEGKVSEEVTVASADELQDGHMKLLWVNGERIALAKTADGYCAFQDRCTHRGASLAGGVLVGDTVHCLWHGSQFNVRTGQVVCGPAREKIKLFQVHVKGKDVRLVIPSTEDR